MAPCHLGELGPLLSMYRVAREGWGSLLEDRRAERWIVAAILLVAVAVRVHHLGKEPLWNDEGFTWWAIGQSWHDLWTLVPQGDPHPPFYYSLLKLWTALAGQSEAGLRGLSTLFAAATVPVVYLAGRTLGGARDRAWTGAAAALLFALSPLHLHYAQEARPYAGLTFAASLAFAGALWLVLHPGPARRPLLGWGRGVAADEPSARPAWLALVVGTALALWFHNLGVYLPAALGPALLAWLARDLRWDRSAFANLALAGGLVLLAWSPWWPWLLRQTRDVGKDWYLPFPTSATVLKVLSSLFGLGYSIPTRLFEACLVAALVGLVAVGRRAGLAAALLLGLGAVVPVGLSLLISRLFQPVFLERTLVWTSLPFYLALAGILLLLPARLPRLAVLALAAWLSAQGAVRYDAKYNKEPWDRVVATIGRELQPGDVVLVVPNFTLPMVDYYERKLGVRLPTLPVPYDEATLGSTDVSTVTEDDLERLGKRTADARDVWVVYRRTPELSRADDAVLDALRASRPQLRADLVYGKTMWLYRFGPAATKGSTVSG